MVEIFGFELRLYGLMIGLAVYVGGFVISKLAKREGVGEDLIWDGLVWVVIPAIVGARLYHVIDLWSYYGRNWWDIVAVWKGGLGVFGGLIGGGLGLWGFWSWKINGGKKEKGQLGILGYLDLVAIGLPLGQAIGRWGNYFNQELYGKPTSLPWGVAIGLENRIAGYESFSKFQPLFLYESLLSLSLFGALLCSYKYNFIRLGKGKYLGMYLMGYGIIRFLLEPMRLESWSWGQIPVAQIFSAGMIGLGFWLILRRKSKK